MRAGKIQMERRQAMPQHDGMRSFRCSRRMVGRYLNLGKPEITRPWVGLVVDESRIDGYWTQGRLDFRR
jgi:hypothetical protein